MEQLPFSPHEARVASLYPNLSEEAVRAAADNLDRYVALAARVFERLLDDPVAYAAFERLKAEAYDERERSIPLTQDTA